MDTEEAIPKSAYRNFRRSILTKKIVSWEKIKQNKPH